MRRILHFGFIAATAVLGLAFQPGNLLAGAFTVTPTRVEFDRPGSSALLTLSNEGTEPLRFQITAFEWKQDPKGEMQLNATQDVIFFPTLLELGAKEQRKVRIGLSTSQASVEKSYRIFFEELPPLEKKDEEKGTQVRILTKMGIPIFVKPTAKATPVAAISAPSIAGGKLRFTIANSGNAHFVLQSVQVKASDANGAALFDRKQDGWYILANGTREMEMELQPEECRKLRAVTIEASTDIASGTPPGVVSQQYSLQGSCGE